MLITDFLDTKIEGGREQAIEVLAEFISLRSAEENEVFDEEDYFTHFLETARDFAVHWKIPFDMELIQASLQANCNYERDYWMSSTEICEC